MSLTPDQKVDVHDHLVRAAARLDAGLDGITSSHLTIQSEGVKLTLFRQIGEAMAHAEFILTFEEIGQAKTDLLDMLITQMREELLKVDEVLIGGSNEQR